MSLTPIKTHNKLSNTPSSPPKYSTKVKDALGNEVICGCPDTTRALVALMDLGAVNGGAASHWGGPAGAAEIMSATHALMFKNQNWFFIELPTF